MADPRGPGSDVDGFRYLTDLADVCRRAGLDRDRGRRVAAPGSRARVATTRARPPTTSWSTTPRRCRVGRLARRELLHVQRRRRPAVQPVPRPRTAPSTSAPGARPTPTAAATDPCGVTADDSHELPAPSASRPGTTAPARRGRRAARRVPHARRRVCAAYGIPTRASIPTPNGP